MLFYFNIEVSDAFYKSNFENELESVSSEVMVMIEKNASIKEASVQTNKESKALFFDNLVLQKHTITVNIIKES